MGHFKTLEFFFFSRPSHVFIDVLKCPDFSVQCHPITQTRIVCETATSLSDVMAYIPYQATSSFTGKVRVMPTDEAGPCANLLMGFFCSEIF